VSVVVCVRNGARDLPRLFVALRAQTLARERFEVILVDDASTDDTVALAEREPGVRVVRAPGHVGLPRARNIGASVATAPVLAFTDADTEPDPRWLELGARRFAEDAVDLLAGGVPVPLGERPSLAAMLDATTHFDQEAYVERGYSVGANVWVRRPLFHRLGGFNERLAAYGGDDHEFGQLATESGARLVYAPEVLVSHPPRTSLRVLARKRYRLGYGMAAHRRYRRGPRRPMPRLFLQPRAYVPHRGVDLRRLSAAGFEPRGLEEARLQAVRWLYVHLPRVFGDLRGEIALARVARRGPHLSGPRSTRRS